MLRPKRKTWIVGAMFFPVRHPCHTHMSKTALVAPRPIVDDICNARGVLRWNLLAEEDLNPDWPFGKTNVTKRSQTDRTNPTWSRVVASEEKHEANAMCIEHGSRFGPSCTGRSAEPTHSGKCERFQARVFSRRGRSHVRLGLRRASKQNKARKSSDFSEGRFRARSERHAQMDGRSAATSRRESNFGGVP